MSAIFLIAKRFISPKKQSGFVSFITIISIVGVAIGAASLIITISVLNGFEKEITEKTVSLSSHIQINSFKPEGIMDYQTIMNVLKDSISQIKTTAPYVQKEAVIKYKDRTEGIIVKGIRNEDKIFTSQRKIVEGDDKLVRFDSSLSSIIIGNKLASKLNITIGSKVVIFATNGIPSPLNQPLIKQFKVVGFYESGLKEYDDVLVYLSLEDAQKLFVMGPNVTGIELMLKDINQIEPINEKVRKFLGYPYAPRTVFRIYKGLFTWVELQKKPIPIVLGLIVIVAAFNIIGTLLMIVLEKTRSIGVLKTLGSSNRDIIKIFTSQGLIIALIGVVLGNLLGYGLCLLQLRYNIITLPDVYYMNKVPMVLESQTGIIVSILTIIVCLLATFLPSYMASKLKPITSIKFS